MENHQSLPDKWVETLVNAPETGMGYWVVTVKLTDGRIFERVVINGGYVTQIYGLSDIPFNVKEITEIKVTHDKWNFNESHIAT